MSFIITLYVREGIVMASDSRLTLNAAEQQSDKQILQVAVGQSDSSYKTFRALERIGISTYGAADIKGVPIAGFIQTFVRELDDGTEVDEVPARLLHYFKTLQGPQLPRSTLRGTRARSSTCGLSMSRTTKPSG
jgi:hypothetical protein